MTGVLRNRSELFNIKAEEPRSEINREGYVMRTATIAGAMAAGLVATSAMAEPVTIKYSFPAPPKSLVDPPESLPLD